MKSKGGIDMMALDWGKQSYNSPRFLFLSSTRVANSSLRIGLKTHVNQFPPLL